MGFLNFICHVLMWKQPFREMNKANVFLSNTAMFEEIKKKKRGGGRIDLEFQFNNNGI